MQNMFAICWCECSIQFQLVLFIYFCKASFEVLFQLPEMFFVILVFIISLVSLVPWTEAVSQSEALCKKECQ